MQIQWLNAEQCNTGTSDHMSNSSATVIGRKYIEMMTVDINENGASVKERGKVNM